MAIHLLDDITIRRIAAGEVVDRPASVVKELVENALDAGASHVRVVLADGGRARIRVIDDGHGMDAADAELCLQRHATSKIQSLEDLYQSFSLGFRGEALPSIASVTRFSLVTRPPDQELGTRIEVEDGVTSVVGPVAAPVGTDIDCRSLFHAVPVRRKFLRAAGTELTHCQAVLDWLALARPDVGFELVHDDRTLLRCPPEQTLAQRARAVLGPVARGLMPIDETHGEVQLSGLVAPPGRHLASARKALHLFVNGRYVTDKLVRKGVLEAYRTFLPKGRYPLVVLDVRLAPDRVDVNVHPHKVEVRFVDGRAVVEALERGISRALAQHGVKRELGARTVRPAERSQLVLGEEPALPAHPDDDAVARPVVEAPVLDEDDWLPTERPPLTDDAVETVLPWLADVPSEPRVEAVQLAKPVEVEVEAVPEGEVRTWRPIGTVGALWLCEDQGALVVIDPVAVAQRLLLSRWRAAPTPRRRLVPLVVDVDADTVAWLQQGRGALAEMGIELGGSEGVALSGLPDCLGALAPERLLEEAALGLAHGEQGAVLQARICALGAPPEDDPLSQRTALASLSEVRVPEEGLLPLYGRLDRAALRAVLEER